jgi:hypothetical protein
MKENPYAAPSTPVADSAQEKPTKSSVGARFLWTLPFAFPIFMGSVLLYVPVNRWLMGALGSALFALFAACIAMCIPVKPKAGFIIPSILIAVYCAYRIGTRGS